MERPALRPGEEGVGAVPDENVVELVLQLATGASTGSPPDEAPRLEQVEGVVYACNCNLGLHCSWPKHGSDHGCRGDHVAGIAGEGVETRGDGAGHRGGHRARPLSMVAADAANSSRNSGFPSAASTTTSVSAARAGCSPRRGMNEICRRCRE